jgi:hypothetical protein
VRSPLTAGSIARIQLVSHAHMTVSVHLTRLAHAGHADLGPEDRLVLPTWQHTARPHTDHPVRDAVNAGKPTVGCRSERRISRAGQPVSCDRVSRNGSAWGCKSGAVAASDTASSGFRARHPHLDPRPPPKFEDHAALHEPKLIAAARSQMTASSPRGTFSQAELAGKLVNPG